MRYLCELHTCIHCHRSGHSVCARIIHTEEHSIHTYISVPIGECVLEEMSLWCLYPMYIPSNVHSHLVKFVVVVVVYRFQ